MAGKVKRRHQKGQVGGGESRSEEGREPVAGPVPPSPVQSRPVQSHPVQPGAGGKGRWTMWAVASGDVFSVWAHLG